MGSADRRVMRSLEGVLGTTIAGLLGLLLSLMVAAISWQVFQDIS